MVGSTSDNRRALKGERTQAKLLEIAIAQFADDGYGGTSVSDIARAAGLTPAAVYAYFPSKEALFDAAVEQDVAILLEQAASSIANAERPGLSTFVGLLGALPAHPLAGRIIREGTPDQLRLITGSAFIAEMTASVAEFLRRRQADGRLAAEHDPDVLAVGIEMMVMSLFMARVRTGLEPDPSRIAGVVALFDAAIGGRPAIDERPPPPVHQQPPG